MKKKDDLEKRVDSWTKNYERVQEMKKSKKGKYKVIGIDKFDYEDWVHGEYNTAEEAIGEARRMTSEAMPHASDSSIATVYYAYDPQGKYLGGDSWHEKTNVKRIKRN